MIKGKDIFKVLLSDPKLTLLRYKYDTELLSMIKKYKNTKFPTYKSFYDEFQKMITRNFKETLKPHHMNLLNKYVRKNIYPMFDEEKN